MLDVVRATAESVFLPLTVGGGVRSVEDVRALLLAGADKVGNQHRRGSRIPDLVRRASDAFGNQAIVVAVDARREPDQPLRWQVFTARRAPADRNRRGCVVRTDGARGGRRASADQHGPRWYARRIRPRADARGGGSRLDPG
jgi:imidazole glycerol phosphate synthase subunit HisF